MNYGPLIFLGLLLALATSWYGMVVAPLLQFGRQQQVGVGPAKTPYPTLRTGQAQAGREVYRANGCFYCHTMQVRQSGAVFDVMVASGGTNKADLVAAIVKVKPGIGAGEAQKLIDEAPKPILQRVTRSEAVAAAKALDVPDAKISIVLVPVGADMERAWGGRVSVAQDYLYEQPLMLGHQRIGPDLTTIGARQKNAAWHMLHLYSPQMMVKGSTMPPYRFLFEKRKIGNQPSPDALQLTGEQAVESGFEVVPKDEARALVAYLLSMETQLGVFEGPLPSPPRPPDTGATTNQTANASSISAPATNAPSK
jgi:cbb3-type cytochrome oxidase cytochrome c subunit